MKKEVNPEMFKEFAKAMGKMIDEIINIADKYGEDRNECVNDVIVTMKVSSMFTDFRRFS